MSAATCRESRGEAEWRTVGCTNGYPVARRTSATRRCVDAVGSQSGVTSLSSAHAMCSHTNGSGSSSARVSTASAVPTLPNTMAALRFTPRSFARLIGEPLKAALNASCDIARISRESVTASLPRMNSRDANGDPAANSRENFTFHGHTLWEMCRYTRFVVELDRGRRTLRTPRGEGPPARHVR